MSGIEAIARGIGTNFMRVATHSLQSAWMSAHGSHLAMGLRKERLRRLSRAEIASNHFPFSKPTVRFHLDNVVEKFWCKTRSQAIALLAQLGLLGPIGA